MLCADSAFRSNFLCSRRATLLRCEYAVPRTSTFALTNSTLPYALKLANFRFKAAVKNDPDLAAGVNTYAGKLTYQAVALSQEREYTPLDELLES
jgi:alanine dehydrogenase